MHIPVHNPYSSSHTFRVETDLMNCYGPPTIILFGSKRQNYPLTINPLISGKYTGTLIFYD